MPRYHITPSGDPRPCRAQKSCPYGDLITDHYGSKDEARVAIEVQMNQAVEWISSLKFYSKQSAAYSGDKRRRYADSYFTTREEHRVHLAGFARELGYGCMYCGSADNVYLNEHMIPASRGGITVVGNVGPSCKTCNSSKGDSTALEYYAERLTQDQANPRFPTMEDFMDFNDRYVEPFVQNYPAEYDLALRVIEYDDEAEMEFARAASQSFKSWLVTQWSEKHPDEDFDLDEADAEFLAGRYTLSSEYEKLYKDTEVWQTLDSVEEIQRRTKMAIDTARDVRSRKHNLQASWMEAIGNKSVTEISEEEWLHLCNHYLSRYSRATSSYESGNEYTKAKRTLRAFAILSDREDLDRLTASLPGYATFGIQQD